MPRYRITDSTSGRTLLVEGAAPPTEADAEELFASAPAVAVAPPPDSANAAQSTADESANPAYSPAASSWRNPYGLDTGQTIEAPPTTSPATPPPAAPNRELEMKRKQSLGLSREQRADRDAKSKQISQVEEAALRLGVPVAATLAAYGTGGLSLLAGAAGGFTGEVLAQESEMARGARDQASYGQMAAAPIIAGTPLGPTLKGAAYAKDALIAARPAAIATRAAFGGAISGGADAISQAIDTGEVDSAGVLKSAAYGTLFGGVMGGVETLQTTRRMKAALFAERKRTGDFKSTDLDLVGKMQRNWQRGRDGRGGPRDDGPGSGAGSVVPDQARPVDQVQLTPAGIPPFDPTRSARDIVLPPVPPRPSAPVAPVDELPPVAPVPPSAPAQVAPPEPPPAPVDNAPVVAPPARAPAPVAQALPDNFDAPDENGWALDRETGNIFNQKFAVWHETATGLQTDDGGMTFVTPDEMAAKIAARNQPPEVQPPAPLAAPETPPAPVTVPPAAPPSAPGFPAAVVSTGTTSRPAPLTTPPAAPEVKPSSRRQIAEQRAEIRRLTKLADQAAQSSPERAGQYTAQAQQAREQLAEMESNTITGPTPQVGPDPLGNADLLTQIADYVGKINMTPPANSVGGEYDGLAAAFSRGAARLLRAAEGGTNIVNAITELNAAAGTKFESPSQFFEAVDRAVSNRQNVARDLDRQAYRDKVEGMAQTDTKKGRPRALVPRAPNVIDQVGVGGEFELNKEKFSVVDTAEGPGGIILYIIQDGHRITIPEGTPIYPDKGSLKIAEVAPQKPAATGPQSDDPFGDNFVPEPDAAPAAPPVESPADLEYRLQNEKFDASLKKQRADAAAAEAAKPPELQDPDFWVSKQVERIAVERGLSIEESRQMHRASAQAMMLRIIKRQVDLGAPIHVNAVGEQGTHLGYLKKTPKGYVRDGDYYVKAPPAATPGTQADLVAGIERQAAAPALTLESASVGQQAAEAQAAREAQLVAKRRADMLDANDQPLTGDSSNVNQGQLYAEDADMFSGASAQEVAATAPVVESAAPAKGAWFDKILSEYRRRMAIRTVKKVSLDNLLKDVIFDVGSDFEGAFPPLSQLLVKVPGRDVDFNKLTNELFDADSKHWEKFDLNSYFTPTSSSIFDKYVSGATWYADENSQPDFPTAPPIQEIAKNEPKRIIEMLGEDRGLKWLAEVQSYRPEQEVVRAEIQRMFDNPGPNDAEAGRIDPQLLFPLARAVVGGIAGYLEGDTPEEKLAYALAGGLGLGLLGSRRLARRTLAALTPARAPVPSYPFDPGKPLRAVNAQGVVVGSHTMGALEHVRAIEMPELVHLARQLSGNDVGHRLPRRSDDEPGQPARPHRRTARPPRHHAARYPVES